MDGSPPPPRMSLSNLTQKNKAKIKVLSVLSSPPRDTGVSNDSSVGTATSLLSPAAARRVSTNLPKVGNRRISTMDHAQEKLSPSNRHNIKAFKMAPPSPQQLRATLSGNIMPNRRVGDSLNTSTSPAATPTRSTGRGILKKENEQQQQQASSNETLLPMIGIFEKPSVIETSPPSGAGGGVSAALAAVISPKSGKKRRNAYMRKATVEEIQFFTDLLKQSMVTETKVTVAYDDDLIMQGELLRMNAAETEQCQVDRFWGVEYEQACQTKEMELMYQEDIRSRLYQEERKLEHKWQEWTEWDAVSKREEVAQAAVTEQKKRRAYLQEFCNVKCTDRIVNYHWNSKKHAASPPRPRQTAATTKDVHPSQGSELHGFKLDVTIKSNSNSATFHTSRKRQQLVHVSCPKEKDQTSSPRRSFAKKEERMARARSHSKSPLRSNLASIGKRERPEQADDAPASLTQNNDPDEQSVLKRLFDSVDVGGEEVISRDQFLKAIQYNQQTRLLLRKTFLWSIYRSRQWKVFVKMFEPKPSTHLITFPEFYASCQKCQLETHVETARIRPLQCSSRPMIDSEFNRKAASYKVGTLVEFTFRRGPIWQPGRVIRKHVSEDKEGVTTYDIQCDVSDRDVPFKIARQGNQHQEKEGGGKKGEEVAVLMDEFFSQLEQGRIAGRNSSNNNNNNSSDYSAVPISVILESVKDPKHAKVIRKCKPLAALSSSATLRNALQNNAQLGCLTRPEFHAWCDALNDVVIRNNLF